MAFLSVKEIASRVEYSCDLLNVYVITDISSLGLNNDDILRLYRWVAKPETIDYHGGILCTAWLHALHLLQSTPAVLTSVEIEGYLKMADNVLMYLGCRSGHPENGLIIAAVRDCLQLGRTVGVIGIEEYAHQLQQYGD